MCPSSGKCGTEAETIGTLEKDLIIWTFFFLFLLWKRKKTMSSKHGRQKYFIRRDDRIREG